MTAHSEPPVLICPIRYDGGPREEDRRLWVELRDLFADSPVHLLAFVTVSGPAHWIDRFNPVPRTVEGRERASMPLMRAVDLPDGA